MTNWWLAKIMKKDLILCLGAQGHQSYSDLWATALPKATCSNPRYSWVTYFILSSFCYFSRLVLSTHPLLLYQFLSPYQSFVVLSNFCHFLTLCYLLTFTLSTHPINAPAVHITNTTLFPVLSCARSLRQYTFLTHQASLAIVPFWCGGIEAWLGVSS